MNELVSVIIPAYNHQDFIEEAILSVYNQTYEFIELILIDDKSEDKTYEKALRIINKKEFKKRFYKVIFLQNENNEGAHNTINKGIALSSGKFISILNSDDFYDSYRIEKLLSSWKGDRYFFAFSNYLFVDEDSTPILFHPLFIKLQLSIKEAFEDFLVPWFMFLQKNIALSTGNFFFSKELYNKIGGFADLSYCHDLHFILHALRYTNPCFVDEPLYYYRIHRGNTFREVSHLSIVEAEIVLSEFFFATEYLELVNPECPCRINFPVYFENFLKKFNLEVYFTRSVTGYMPVHRVIEKQLFEHYNFLKRKINHES
uniref:Glycosyltransferase n=1 Tax=Thermodesulfobacterium geofontis TaxID=1295609 RepID=A0A7V5XFB0_9BACT